MSIMQNLSLIYVKYPMNVGGITILGTVIIGGMIWITRSNVKFRIWVNSEGQFIENDLSKIDLNFMGCGPVFRGPYSPRAR